MGGILLLCGFLICGVVLAEALLAGERPGGLVPAGDAHDCAHSPLARLWLGLCLGLMLMMWLPALFAFALKFTLTAQLLGLGCAAIAAIAMYALRIRGRGRCGGPFCGELPPWFLLALLVPLLLLSLYLQYTHTLRAVDGALHVGQSTYGDLCLHLGIATSARNAAFPPDYSILPGTLLGYPFLADTMVTSMLLCGGDLALSFALTGTLMMGLVYLGFILFAWELTHSKAAVALAYALMFCNGGLGFLYTFDGVFRDPTMLRNVFTGFYQTPTNMPELNLRWVNVICDMMIPQRTLLTGWMALLPALDLLLYAERGHSRARYLLLGIWAGFMPMVHTHSFLALGMLSAGVAVCGLMRAERGARRDALLNYLTYGLTAVVIALPQLLTWTFPQTVGGGSLAVRFNWVNNRGDGRLIDEYFWFWIKNVGLVYIFMVPAALSMKKGSLQRALALGALLIYGVAELIQFQPNEYDNNKLFYVSFMVMLPMVAQYLTVVFAKLKGLRVRGLLAALFILASTLSGALSLARETVSDYQLFSAEEVQAARFIEENLPADAVLLTGDQHNNAVAALTGRNIVCGTGSYLYFHGIDYSAQHEAEAQMLADPANSAELFARYGVDYAYISNQERYNFDADEAWFAQNCALLYSEGSIRIYELAP